eukprot:scaffold3723_cov112-Isochrysis_galbana.AAC.10
MRWVEQLASGEGRHGGSSRLRWGVGSVSVSARRGQALLARGAGAPLTADRLPVWARGVAPGCLARARARGRAASYPGVSLF